MNTLADPAEIKRVHAKKIEAACRAHDQAGKQGEDRYPYRQRINELRDEMHIAIARVGRIDRT